MIGAKGKTTFNAEKVKRKANDGTFRSLGHAAATIRLIARRSIKRRKGPSKIGQPPHTRAGMLKRAILFFVDKARGYALIGVSEDILDDAGMPHEHGGRFRKETFGKRPFMLPALEKAKPRLPTFWANSIRN